MSTGWNKNQIGWKFDDLWENGWRFDNEKLGKWCLVPKDVAKDNKEAIEWLVINIESIPLYDYV